MKFCKVPFLHEFILWIWTFALFMEFFSGIFLSNLLPKSILNLRRSQDNSGSNGRCGMTFNMRKYFRPLKNPWIVLDLIFFVAFLVAFIYRIMCMASSISASNYHFDFKELFHNGTLFNGNYKFTDVTDSNCPLYFYTNSTLFDRRPDLGFESKSYQSKSLLRNLPLATEASSNGTSLLTDAPMLDEHGEELTFRYMRNAQYFYVFSFILACCRILELLTASKNMGPKVKTVVGVVSDLVFFLVILLPFMVGFGVASQSVMYTNEWRIGEVLFGVIWKPFYSMFGELFLAENTNYIFTGRIEFFFSLEMITFRQCESNIIE